MTSLAWTPEEEKAVFPLLGGGGETKPARAPGVLRVSLNQSERHLNRWEPALSSCQPIDYLSILLAKGPRREELDFLRDKTVVLFDDSVGRGFTEHLCMWAGEREELIDEDHPLAPPYPEGREYPPDGYVSLHGYKDFWPGVPFGRPHICTIRKYNFRVVQIFGFGLQEEDEWMSKMNHFYPPGGYEDRFDQILLPLLDNLAARRTLEEGRPVSPVPDLVTLTSSFWTTLRAAHSLDSLVNPNSTAQEWEKKLGNWAPPTREWGEWFARRWSEAVRHVGSKWKDAERKPRLVFRELMMVLARDDIPSSRLAAEIDIGRRVIELLKEESVAAQSAAGWEEWRERERSEFGAGWTAAEAREEVLDAAVGERLEVLEWGRRFMGQQVKHTDDGAAGVHPHPLPGSWLCVPSLPITARPS
ncbi:hypothetical protein JCM10207_000092 [Rhodosporidiobolus poonsookiae]